MTVTRRKVLGWGGGILLAALPLPPEATAEAGAVDIAMTGRKDGSRVWFDPAGLLITAGQTVRWTNADPLNSHTTTAYHPASGGRAQRLPDDAEPWDSGYLLPGESFTARFTLPGVYDYLCVPHEMAGMVGRLVVQPLKPTDWTSRPDGEGVPPEALEAFPSVEEIVAQGAVRRS